MRKIKSLLAIVLMFALMFTLAGCGEIKKAEATVNGMFTALTLDGCGLVGRPGGDEFSAIIEKTIKKHELESLIDGFSADILTVLPNPHRVSSSIGAHRYSCPADLSSLMENTDEALYEAKSLGKARHVIKG